ncbi:MAG: hypothetical protein WKG07_44395 [Hymenobacter sp.]
MKYATYALAGLLGLAACNTPASQTTTTDTSAQAPTPRKGRCPDSQLAGQQLPRVSGPAPRPGRQRDAALGNHPAAALRRPAADHPG